jgi:hypothetical protein
MILNDIAEVVLITVTLPRSAVLGDVPPRIVLEQTMIWTGRRHNLTSGTPCPIIATD